MPLAGSYLDVDEFRARTIAPSALVDGEHIDPSDLAGRAAWRAFVEAQLVVETSRINARLRKRYLVPFADPCPEIVRGWLTIRVTPKLFEKRGWDPSDERAASILKDAETALEEMKEAADGETGLYDLPLRDAVDTSAIAKGGPLGYSEVSPWTWTEIQARRARGQ